MKILISGSTGLLGSALTEYLHHHGYQAVRMIRGAGDHADTVVPWDPAAGYIDTQHLAGMDAVVHLAGENIASGRWTLQKKHRIRESRVLGTRLLSEALAGLEHKPQVLISASAVGYYGEQDSPAGDDFLATVCQAWEEATLPAKEAGIRVIHARFGMILSPHGGALGRMLLPFRLGLGGPLGNGNQYISWIALPDVLGAILHMLHHRELQGPVNVVTPHAVTNREFTKTLGHVLNRPAIAPVPPFALRLIFGEMADALLLSSIRVRPVRLLETEYVFQYPQLEEALVHLLDG